MNTASPGLPRTPSFRLDGKRALITGAGRGLGLAMAAALAEYGAAVTLCARSSAELDSLAAAIRANAGTAETLVCDVTDTKAFAAAVEAAAPFDIFVNNAGTNRPKPVQEVTEDDYDVVMDLNLRAAYFAMQAVIKQMLASGRAGSIINISSQMGHVGGPKRTLYCASKWGIEGFTRAAAIDLAGTGIRVNTLCPTFIETPLTQPFLADKAFSDYVLGKIKLGRLGQVEDLMGPVVFLASDASALMTGASLMLDGGWTIG
jgi:NAD(P)-dependent dehydrogenase (short-subunit alcohol dehydrogenase family)